MAFAGGSGTQADPWQIETAQQLDDLRLYTGSSHADKYFVLNNDIDLTDFLSPTGAGYNSGAFWKSIPDFYGHLNGAGFCILNFKINYYKTGLFQHLKSGSTVVNLNFDNAEVVSTANYGGAVLAESMFESSVSGVNVSNSTLIGLGYVGFIAGSIGAGSISDCICSGAVSGTWNVGGIVGFCYITTSNSVSVERCSMEGTVERVSTHIVNGGIGGIIGGARGNAPNYVYINDCVNKADIQGSSQVGGICGLMRTYVELTDCHNEGDVEGAPAECRLVISADDEDVTLDEAAPVAVSGDVAKFSVDPNGDTRLLKKSVVVTGIHNTDIKWAGRFSGIEAA